MCGLFAALSRSAPIGRDYSAAVASIRHRGPDDQGHVLVSLTGSAAQPRDRAWLGHARLSIIDLTDGGHQPMVSPDGRFQMIYNGEIYNYLELREELRAAGVAFSTESDSEVLLQAWITWGEACLTRLKGMFAFILIDRQDGKAVIVRDFFGIKPIYYAETDDEILIASEPLPIVGTGKVSTALDPEIVYEHLRFGASGSTERTILAGIRTLPAAHLMVFDFATGRLEAPKRYWQLKESDRAIGFADAVAECRERFMTNVRLHLRSDVPVGAALSGGIDSSAIVCAMRILEPALDLQTFSYIAADAAHSEERWVDLVHQQVGGVCHKIRPEPTDLADDLDLLVRHQGEPFGTASMYAQFRVFRRAREAGVPVTLDGQGADELLAGYWPHVGTAAAERLRSGRVGQAARLLMNGASGLRGKAFMAGILGQAMLPASARALARKASGRGVFPAYLDKDWFAAANVDWKARADELIGRHATLKAHLIGTVDKGSLPNLLRYADRSAMAFSVESRVPFLTHDFAEFLMALPSDYLISRDGVRKYVFREAMRGILPEPIRQRQDKIGFFADDALWLRANAARFHGLWEELAAEPMFRRDAFLAFVDGFFQKRHDNAALVWRAMVFGVWLRHLRAAAGVGR
jgi:asparagine synthase (glutamine-hydrolysing)